jgi:hypothetical protein
MSIEKKALEENIRSVLTDDIAREIVKFCKESHTSSEIIDQMLRKLSSMSSNRAWWERVVSDNLRRLENAQVVTYMADGKWKMSSEAKTILEKYFGGL